MGFSEGLDIVCETEKGIKNDSRVFGLSQMKLTSKMGKTAGRTWLWKCFGDSIWTC